MINTIILISLIFLAGFLLSENRKKINWKSVGIATVLQLTLILFVMKTSIGQKILEIMSNSLNKVLSFGNEGLAFVFGDFATNNYSFAINVLGMICFTSAVMSVLYYIGVIPFLVKHIGGFLAKILGTTPVETFGAVGCSFFSGTEAPLLIKPYLKDLTRSELFTLCLGGFASASVSILAGYTLLGIPMKYLLIATFTSPLATLIFAKLLVPETEKSKLDVYEVRKSEDTNIFEAIGNGSVQGVNIAISVGATLIGFLGFVGLLNYGLGFVGQDLSSLLGALFTPLGWLFNIPQEEISTFSSLIAMKTAINEYVAYTDMSIIIGSLSPRTLAILSVALCNFANFSVIGIQTAFYKAVCPERSTEVAKMGLKALVGGLLTTLLSGAIVGLFV
ncbi:NupC/NupG family nucleoside CNT transporter [Zhenhengia yiwuensis]|uniref:NupC/NupG family nucleoside CNT transporter n=1 Tax=Zhenhengia yiwuensis TaxID=2763666 RepID=UPI0020164E9A|nr:nucleoside transporter C-terminal domain-containing protein [Zhenhengia yiwuensis]